MAVRHAIRPKLIARSRSPGGVAVCRRTTVADVHPDASDGRLLDAIFPMDVQSDNPALSVVPFLI
jgi:hypothetical protein